MRVRTAARQGQSHVLVHWWQPRVLAWWQSQLVIIPLGGEKAPKVLLAPSLPHWLQGQALLSPITPTSLRADPAGCLTGTSYVTGVGSPFSSYIYIHMYLYMYIFQKLLCISKLPGRLFLEVLLTGCALSM